MTRVVRVQFRNSPSLYDYFTDVELHEGDYAVVPTRPGYAVVRVVEVRETSAKATAWVVQKVDTEGYEERMREKRIPIKPRKRRKVVR